MPATFPFFNFFSPQTKKEGGDFSRAGLINIGDTRYNPSFQSSFQDLGDYSKTYNIVYQSPNSNITTKKEASATQEPRQTPTFTESNPLQIAPSVFGGATTGTGLDLTSLFAVALLGTGAIIILPKFINGKKKK